MRLLKKLRKFLKIQINSLYLHNYHGKIETKKRILLTLKKKKHGRKKRFSNS